MRFTSLAITSVALALAAGAHCSAQEERACGAGSAACGANAADPQYIVVGSGAGGGPLAARLARAGKRVLLVEAGQDVGDRAHYRVPAMHAIATEDPEMAWWYFVKHHADANVDETDSKITKDGILYPRGSALGGSTAVNAMVSVLPSPADWDRLAELANDRDYRAKEMTSAYARVREWLSIEIPNPSLALGDATVTSFLRAAATQTESNAGALSTLLTHDVNGDLEHGEASGLFRLPLATKDGVRNGPREHLLETVREGYPLTIMTGTFVTKVLLDDGPRPRAVGVEVVRQHNVYGANLARDAVDTERERITTRGEVILAAGAFNSPQLLQLSGIGDAADLARLGIEARVDRPGVGRNLQDRYEAAVVSEVSRPLDVVARCKLGEDESRDPCLGEWNEGRGVYRTPGFLASVLRRSEPELALADLQIFAAPTDARGYYPGYSADAARAKDRFSWLLLKAHTKNRDGYVRVVSDDPFRRPEIHFRSFDERDPLHDPDLRALVRGVSFVRDTMNEARALMPETRVDEVWPGAAIASDDEVAAFVRKEAWGHHACCTNAMGSTEDAEAVVDATFRVIGVDALRVVDASVFPEIPGTFIALPTYMLAEKAAEKILRSAP